MGYSQADYVLVNLPFAAFADDSEIGVASTLQ